MHKKILFTLFSVTLFLAASLPALSSPAIGGYDAAKLVRDTLTVLEQRGTLSAQEVSALNTKLAKDYSDPMILAIDTVRFYDALGQILIQKNILTLADLDALKNTASKSGGIKAAGLNPVVLSAAYLNFLAQKNILSLKDAQKILNDAKK